MKCLNKESGFALVEVLVALVILVIIIFAFTTLFTSSFQGIFRAGNKSEALFESQEEIDQFIAEGGSSGVDTITIEFSNLVIEPEGEVKVITYNYENFSGELTYFLPQ